MLNQASDCFVAGRRRRFVDAWSELTSDLCIFDFVQRCHLDIRVEDVQHLFFQRVMYKFNAVEQDVISAEIHNLLLLQVFSVTEGRFGQIISPIFLRKKNGGYRLVLNLEHLHLHTPYIHFKNGRF